MKNEAMGRVGGGRERNLKLHSKIGKSGKTHMAEHMLSPWLGLPAAQHFVHVISSNKFGSDGVSRERSHRYVDKFSC